jgi:hypothetical protein
MVCAVNGAVMRGGGVACAAAPATTLVNPRPKDNSALNAHFMLDSIPKLSLQSAFADSIGILSD